MAVTMKTVTSLLSAEEPLYSEAARLGPDALPHLETLARGSDPLMASKAVYLASLIDHDHAADIVRLAARSDHPVIRVAAAAAAQNLTSEVTRAVLDTLTDDKDHGVRKTAQRALAGDIGTIPTASESDTPAANVAGSGGGLLPGGSGDRLGDNTTGQGGGALPTDRAPDSQASGAAGQGGGSVLPMVATPVGDQPSGATTGQGGGSFDGAVTMSSERDAIGATNLPTFGGGGAY